METRRSQPARIIDVARLAGVSAQTVSNVMNGRPGFTAATRDRVLAAVTEVGYSPNPAARHLRTQEARRIGFSMTSDNLDPRNPFALSFLSAVINTAADAQRRVVVLMHEEHDGSFAADVSGRDVDGFVLVNSSPGDYRVGLLAQHGVPFALMGRTRDDEPQPWVDIDNRAGIGHAVDHLVGRGITSFGYVGYDGPAYWDRERLEGAHAGLARHGLTLPDEHVLLGTLDRLDKPVRRLLRSPHRPQALITASDSLGVLVVNAAHAESIRIPDQLAVTGFDGGPGSRIVFPHLTSVRVPIVKIAQMVTQRLLTEIEGRSDAPGQTVGTRIQQGGTT